MSQSRVKSIGLNLFTNGLPQPGTSPQIKHNIAPSTRSSVDHDENERQDTISSTKIGVNDHKNSCEDDTSGELTHFRRPVTKGRNSASRQKPSRLTSMNEFSSQETNFVVNSEFLSAETPPIPMVQSTSNLTASSTPIQNPTSKTLYFLAVFLTGVAAGGAYMFWSSSDPDNLVKNLNITEIVQSMSEITYEGTIQSFHRWSDYFMSHASSLLVHITSKQPALFNGDLSNNIDI